jgi:AbrB family looped-hinge helix DNA binding protein
MPAGQFGMGDRCQALPYRLASAILLPVGTARVYKKGQVTIPKAVRAATGIDVGDPVVVEARDKEIVVRRPRGVLEFEPPAARRGSKPRWPEARRAAREERIARPGHQDNS